MAETETTESILTQEAPQEDTSSGTWRESLPEDLREAGSLKDIPDIPTLAKAYTDAQSYIGRSIRIPGEDAGEDAWSDFAEKIFEIDGIDFVPTEESSEEEWGEFYNRLGRPEDATGYNIDRAEDTVENPEVEAAILELAHSLGLNNTQASGLINWMNQGSFQAQEQFESSQAESLSSLKDEWGQAFDSKLKDAKAALQIYGDENLVNELNATGLGNNVQLIKAFAEIGKGFAEDPAIDAGGTKSMGMTPTEALAQIQEIQANPAHAYNDDSNPGHQAAIEKMQNLYQAAYVSDETGEPDAFERRFSAG
tara:strand:+ start:150 stop:1076 length:927 start_codon:yes stop_codon:yes gene_type:complete